MTSDDARRASAVLHRDLRYTPPVAVAGDGAYIIDAQGRRYLDASGGAAVSCLGHNHPRIVAAVREQIGRLEYIHTSFFTNEPSEALAQALVDLAPPGFGHGRVAFLGSGSEAIEAALKLARQYFVECGEPSRGRFHLAPRELSRQHAWRASGWRACGTPEALCADPDRDVADRAMLRLSRPARGRDAASLWPARRR